MFLVHFRHKEVTVYVDDATKPPVGEGLNRPAEITLERIWPNDKTTHTPIKSPARLQTLKYRERLERAAAEMDATFVDYRPESGAWVFRVSHFSKFGIADDDADAGAAPVAVERLNEQEALQSKVQRLRMPIAGGKGAVRKFWWFM